MYVYTHTHTGKELTLTPSTLGTYNGTPLLSLSLFLSLSLSLQLSSIICIFVCVAFIQHRKRGVRVCEKNGKKPVQCVCVCVKKT